MTRSRDFRGVGIFTLIAFSWSWPIFFAVDAWLIPMLIAQGDVDAVWMVALFGHLIAMAGPGIAATAVLRAYHREPLPPWKWGRPRHYLAAFIGMLLLWTLPALLGLVFDDSLSILGQIEPVVWVMVVASLSMYWLGGLSEETGWIAYLVPRLGPHVGKSRALVVSGSIRGLWHWPVLAGPLVAQLIDGELQIMSFGLLSVVLTFQLIVSNIAFGSVFGWVWFRTESLPLLGWMHQWYDAARDLTVLFVVGYASSLWFRLPGILFILVGAVALMQIARREGANMWTLAPPRWTQADA